MHVIIFDEFLYGSLENPCHHNCDYTCVPQHEHVPGHQGYFLLKCAASDSTDKEGGISSRVKSVLHSSSETPTVCCFSFWRQLNFFFPWKFQQEVDTEVQEKRSARPGLSELQWYTPVKFKRSSSFAVGSYSYFVVMKGAQSHGNKPGAVVLSMLRPLE